METIGNQFVVPYNPYLLLKYKCHFNVEVCTSTKAVKYLTGYITKGGDSISFSVKNKDGEEPDKSNEIETFLTGRYYDSTQATHRILGFSMCHRNPPVMKLHLHLPNEQMIVYNEDQSIADVLDRDETTQLIAWWILNQADPRANELLYHEVPKYYTYKKKKWERRQRNIAADEDDGGPLSSMIGRIPVVGLNIYTKEKFFLRLLLYHVRGAKSFEDLRTVTNLNGERIVCPTFHQACIELGLTENDEEAENAFAEIFNKQRGDKRLKRFFVNLCIFQMAADAWAMFQKFKNELCSVQMYHQNLDEPTDEIVNEVLLELMELFEEQDKNMSDFIGADNMPKNVPKEKLLPKELRCEIEFDQEVQAEIAENQEDLLNEGQRHAVKTILEAVEKKEGGIFALEAHGGTGKTFVINYLAAKLRSQKKIVMLTATTAQAATLFDGGRTVHYKLKVPIKLDSTSKCSFKEKGAVAELIQQAALVVIDEYTMGNKKVFETVSRSLCELLSNDLPFGGKTVVLSGDWKQILPVVPNGQRADVVAASLKSSYLWDSVKLLHLTENMRIKNAAQEDKDFAQYLLDVGNGKIETHPEIGEQMIKIPEVMLSKAETLNQLVDEVYPNLGARIKNGLQERGENPNWNKFVHERTIITPTNDECQIINR